MSKPVKPCDEKRFHDRLPCLDQRDGGLCFGAACWDGARGVKPLNLRYTKNCYWIEQVRGYWRRKRYGK